MVTRVSIAFIGLAMGNVTSAFAAPPPASEFLRAPGFTTPLYVESRQFWAFSPKTVVLVEGQQAKAQFASGNEFLGEIATVGSTTKGWLIGSTKWRVGGARQ